MSRFSRLTAKFAEGFMASRYHDALNYLSDRQLAEIGLTRDSIPARARELARSR